MNVNDRFPARPAWWHRLAGLALLLAAGLAPAAGQARSDVEDSAPASRLQAAEACAERPSRLGRLECYDDLFRDRPAAVADASRSPLWRAVAAQEAERDADDVGVMTRETADTVLMSAPALGTVPPRPLLVISCDDAITRFQLHLHEPLEGSRASLRLEGEGVALDQTWRVLDGGHVISGGRGLPAIGTLKRLLGGEDLRLSSDTAVIDGLRFDLDGWRTAIAPLRAMCRW
ncbi:MULTISPECIES: type VI secretion system-associated protein VasI [Halomonas]|uniref:Type VI secretion-associated protein n=1 Tax=Halomonas halophila TaxID=29573 RepID=A0ABQ0U847_9GAMM|nr:MULTISPECIES: type VI secretion system-associated protein VasI [Halomonas]MDR5890380.1 type VI secretion system-associated protein VasI [Halomonas salina]WJY08130.1 type VI secretion system-associated protein VasI [Halomonas halophila]GEK74575.1 type VI secretion-associated protein [Halomonas halophila]